MYPGLSGICHRQNGTFFWCPLVSSCCYFPRSTSFSQTDIFKPFIRLLVVRLTLKYIVIGSP